MVVSVRRCRFALKLYRDQRRIRAIFEWVDFCPINAPNATHNGAAPRPGAGRPRRSSRPEDTSRTPPARAPPTAPRTSKASTGRRPIRPPLRPRYPSSSTSATRSVPGWGAGEWRGLDLSARALERQVSLDVRDLALALRYAYTPSGLSRPTEWIPARGPYPRPLRGGRRTVALRDPTWGVSCTSPTSYDPVSAVARTSRSHGGRRGARGDG